MHLMESNESMQTTLDGLFESVATLAHVGEKNRGCYQSNSKSKDAIVTDHSMQEIMIV